MAIILRYIAHSRVLLGRNVATRRRKNRAQSQSDDELETNEDPIHFSRFRRIRCRVCDQSNQVNRLNEPFR